MVDFRQSSVVSDSRAAQHVGFKQLDGRQTGLQEVN